MAVSRSNTAKIKTCKSYSKKTLSFFKNLVRKARIQMRLLARNLNSIRKRRDFFILYPLFSTTVNIAIALLIINLIKSDLPHLIRSL